MLKWDKIGRPDYLYQNNGDGTFTNVTRAAGIVAETGRGSQPHGGITTMTAGLTFMWLTTGVTVTIFTTIMVMEHSEMSLRRQCLTPQCLVWALTLAI